MTIAKLKDELVCTKEQLDMLNDKYNLLEAECDHTQEHLDSTTVELANTKTKLAITTTDMTSAENAKASLQKQAEKLQQQLSEAKSALRQKVCELACLLASCERRIVVVILCAFATQISEQEKVEDELCLCQSQLSKVLQVSELFFLVIAVEICMYTRKTRKWVVYEEYI